MRTIFIDFDGTICFGRLWRSLPEDTYQLLQQKLFTEHMNLVKEWMRGERSSEDINKIVSEWLSVPYEELWEVFVHDANNLKVDVETLERIHKLREKNYVVLVTGNMDHFTRFTIPSLQLNEYFDKIVSSYEEKQLKTDNGGETFLKYVQGDIKDAFLIEDSEKTCDIFSKLGGTALQATNEMPIQKHLDFLENL